MSHVHRMVQHRSVLPWVEARTLTSDRTFPRHSHDQLGIGVMLSGGHRSWSGVGHVEAHSGDIIMVNPGEMHDGMPIRGNPRGWRMLYFDPTAVVRMAEAEGANTFEVVRPAVHDPILAARFARLFACVTAASPDPLLLASPMHRTGRGTVKLTSRHSGMARRARPGIQEHLRRGN
jgi:hypothetical protein